ncbi:MAG: YsnF/AvaK domain-containing protein [Ktedonobacteraceae bacterium]
MALTDNSLTAGVFTNETQAQQAMADLQNAGFTDDQIRYSVHKGGSGILDSLVGLGFGQDEANFYNNEFMNGRTVVTVKTNDRQQEAYQILQRYGAYDASRMAQTGGPATATTAQTTSTAYTGTGTAAANYATQGDQKIQLKEEELLATKERVQAGEVGVHKEVISEQKTVNVPVNREEVYIERHAVDQPVPADTPIGDRDEVIRVPVSEERVNVEKQTVVREEIGLGKRVVQENQQVTDTVRREEARIDRQGDVNIQGEGLDDTSTSSDATI